MAKKKASLRQINLLKERMIDNFSIFNEMQAVDAKWAIQNPKEWMNLCLHAMKNRPQNMVYVTDYLKLISGNENHIIDACSGKRIIPDASDIFDYIDPDFRNYRADEVGQATLDAPVSVFELTKDGTYAEIFGSLSAETDKLCLTQDQIIGFVKKYPSCLQRDGYGTCFLFKSFGNYFIARVSLNYSDALRVYVYGFGDYNRRDDDFPRRFVALQLVA